MDYKEVAHHLKVLKEEIPEGVELVAVSKFHPVEALAEAYSAGQRRFGESRVQELLKKKTELPTDIEWHFIGHLQTNKVRMLVGEVALIESVDTIHLLETIDREAQKKGVIARVLMQLHIAREETKFGFSPEELIEYFTTGGFRTLQSTHICGVMGMASNTDDEERIRQDFRKIYSVYRDIKEICGSELRGFDIVSMGMSGDWPIAVEEGSNLIRVGTRIFGEREY